MHVVSTTEALHNLRSLWSSWELTPIVALALVLAAWMYVRGCQWRLRNDYEAAAYVTGWIALGVALAPPIQSLGEKLLSMHMIQNAILIFIAAPLLVLSRPLIPCLLALPMSWRTALWNVSHERRFQGMWRRLINPLPATLLYGAALWMWHVPALHRSSIESAAIYGLRNFIVLAAALLFWWVMIRGPKSAALRCVFATALHTGILGAMLTLAPRFWYPLNAARARSLGINPLLDQHLAGVLMWLPGGVLYMFVMFALAYWQKSVFTRSALPE